MEQGRKTRRRFDQQFKVDAVRLLSESGKTVAEVARELGIGRSELQRWKKQVQSGRSPKHVFPGSGTASAEKKELEDLRRELARVEEEREILEKKPWPSSHDGPDEIPVHRRVRPRTFGQTHVLRSGGFPERVLRFRTAWAQSPGSGQRAVAREDPSGARGKSWDLRKSPDPPGTGETRDLVRSSPGCAMDGTGAYCRAFSKEISDDEQSASRRLCG